MNKAGRLYLKPNVKRIVVFVILLLLLALYSSFINDQCR
jgi:hypothetical protein